MYNDITMTDSDLIKHLMKTNDPVKAEMLAESVRLKAENQRLLHHLLRMRQELDAVKDWMLSRIGKSLGVDWS